MAFPRRDPLPDFDRNDTPRDMLKFLWSHERVEEWTSQPSQILSGLMVARPGGSLHENVQMADYCDDESTYYVRSGRRFDENVAVFCGDDPLSAKLGYLCEHFLPGALTVDTLAIDAMMINHFRNDFLWLPLSSKTGVGIRLVDKDGHRMSAITFPKDVHSAPDLRKRTVLIDDESFLDHQDEGENYPYGTVCTLSASESRFAAVDATCLHLYDAAVRVGCQSWGCTADWLSWKLQWGVERPWVDTAFSILSTGLCLTCAKVDPSNPDLVPSFDMARLTRPSYKGPPHKPQT